MLYTSLLVAAAAISGFASAQNSSALPCCAVAVTEVPASSKSTWCTAERNTCPEICGGLGDVAIGGNTCDSSTLSYNCTCSNGTKPDMSLYQQSVPGLMCRFWYDACINATLVDPSNPDLDAQFECKTERDSQCGNLTTDGETASTTSASSTGGAASTGSSDATASTTVASSASTGAATAMALAREYGTPLFAGGMAALFGLAL